MSEISKEVALELAEQIISGQSVEADKGLVLKTLQIGMSAGLVSGVQKLHEVVAKSMDLYARLDSAYVAQLEEKLQEGVLTPSEIYEERKDLERRITALLNLERQIVQGKNLFPEDTISEDDRKVLRLLSSVKTPVEREKFMRSLEDYFTEKNQFTSSDDELE